MPRRPSAYIDTSVFSALHYRGANVPAIARQMRTEEWWSGERKFFELFTSTSVIAELAQGVYRGQSNALREARRVAFLPHTGLEKDIVEELIRTGLIPENKPGDALQLGAALAHKMDYLLTWNYAHLANHEVAMRLNVLAARHKWRVPWLVSPDTIPWAGLGGKIRREN